MHELGVGDRLNLTLILSLQPLAATSNQNICRRGHQSVLQPNPDLMLAKEQESNLLHKLSADT